MGIFDGSIATANGNVPMTNEMYFNGTSWVPQFTDAGGQAMTQQSYTQQYGNPTPSNSPPTLPQLPALPSSPPPPDNSAVVNNINQGYDAFLGTLDQTLNQGLPAQKSAQEGIVNSQLAQGQADLSGQYTQGMNDLGAQRTKTESSKVRTLRDIGTNLQSAYRAGNMYLGAKGAGDSSAANQYSYALTKVGNKQRGDVTTQYAQIQADIDNKETNLKNIYNTESNKLKASAQEKISQVAQWFASAQNEIRNMVAQGQLNKGKDLATLSQNALQFAQQQLLQAQQSVANQQSMLQQWALSKATDVNQLKQNFAQISATNYNLPVAQPIQGQPTMSGGTPYYPGNNTQDNTKTNLFGGIYA